jgi:hypothetical protein
VGVIVVNLLQHVNEHYHLHSHAITHLYEHTCVGKTRARDGKIGQEMSIRRAQNYESTLCHINKQIDRPYDDEKNVPRAAGRCIKEGKKIASYSTNPLSDFSSANVASQLVNRWVAWVV